MPKVVLVTTFAPNIGGGAVNLNSIIPHFQDLEVVWLYLHSQDLQLEGYEYLSEPCTGGALWQDFSRCFLLWLGFKTAKLSSILARIQAYPADIYWIAGHNEGALIALELARNTHKPVHLTIQDDTPYGVFQRSRRYRWLSNLAQPRFAEALRAVRTLDVTSDGMQRYYQATLGLDSIVIHPYVPRLPDLPPVPFKPQQLIVGHIGSIYALPEFRLFCQALQAYTQTNGYTVQLIMIGLARKFAAVVEEFPQLIVDIPQLSEAEAIQHLAQCNFLYAMYPFDAASAVFRQTSLPTKLTTYIQIQRPILAHTPQDSSLAAAVQEYGLGLVCDALTTTGLIPAIAQVHHQNIGFPAFEQARLGLYSIDNVRQLENCLKSGLCAFPS